MDVTIENLPEEVFEALKAEAAFQRRSINDQLIVALQEEVADWERRKRMRAQRAELDRFRQSLPPMDSSVPLIREDRDGDD